MGDGVSSAAGIKEIYRGVREARRSINATLDEKETEWVARDPNISAANTVTGKLAQLVAEFNAAVAKITIES